MRYLVFFLTLFLGSPVFADEIDAKSVGFFKSVEGVVALQRGDETQNAVEGMQVFPGDAIITGDDSSAAIIFDDGTRVTLGEGAELRVQQFVFVPRDEHYDFSLYLTKGSMIYSSGKLGKLAPEKVNLKTPRATVGIRGTRLLLSVK